MSKPVTIFEGSEDEFRILCDTGHKARLRGILDDCCDEIRPAANSHTVRTANFPALPICICEGGFLVKGLSRKGVAAFVEQRGFDVICR